MALVLNGNRLLAGPAQYRNGASALVFERTSFQRGGPIRNFHLGEATGTASDRAGFPNGAEGSDTWSMPRKGGGLAAYTTIQGAGNLTASDLQPIFEIAGNMAGSGNLAGALSLLSGMSANLAGSGNLAGAIQALSNMAASIGGSGDVAAALGLLVSIQAVVSGSGGLNGSNLTGFANMSASILSYGELTPEGLRDAVWSAASAAYNTAGTMGEKLNDAGSGSNPWTEVIEAGYSAADVLRLISAVLLGNATGLESGAQAFTGLDGTTERVTGTYTDGERTITDLDPAA
jgi:hypothetical protein